MDAFYDAFISYGRLDSKAFALGLHQKLTEQGHQIWFDYNDIPFGVDFKKQIQDGIEKAHNFLFVISPHSVNSIHCAAEIDIAISYNKRIIPLLHIENISRETWQGRFPNGTDQEWESYQKKGLDSCYVNMHPVIQDINWVYFREGMDDMEKALNGLVSTLNRHRDYVVNHTQLLNQALFWLRHYKRNSHLLIDNDLKQAEAWLKYRFQKDQSPCEPTNLHCEYITESIKNSQNKMCQVFLAYATENMAVMQKICHSLQRQGITVWTSQTDIQTGEEFQEAIDRGIEQSNNLVYLLSPEALQSPYCQHEIQYALQLHKRIIPVLVSPTDLLKIPESLRMLQHIDLIHHAVDKEYRNGEQRLIKALSEDATYYETHKILLSKALKWKRQQYNPSILLKGYSLSHYESWLEMARRHGQHSPTELQEVYVNESRKQAASATFDETFDVFISYSSWDIDFARKLNETLQVQSKSTWFEQESITSDIEYKQEVEKGIENAKNFVFILSPNSASSTLCQRELAYAHVLNKRIITIVYKSVGSQDLPEQLKETLRVDFTQNQEDFLINFGQLYRFLESDPVHVKGHTRLLIQAKAWEDAQRDDGLLLRGKSLLAAETWLRQVDDKNPQPTELQLEYLECSRLLPLRKIKLRSVIAVGVMLAFLASILRLSGLLQGAELWSYDRVLLQRPNESEDDRLLIITVDESSGSFLRDRMVEDTYKPGIGTIPDAALEEALKKLDRHQPRLIGLDFYRDFPTEPGLAQTFATMENLIGLCKTKFEDKGVAKPQEIPPERVGFSDFVSDGEMGGKMLRRHLLMQAPDEAFCNTREAFNLVLIRRYLEAQGVPYTSPLVDDPQGAYYRTLQFQETTVPRLRVGQGPYANSQWLLGYQTLLNFRRVQGDPQRFAPTYTLEQLLKDQIPAEDIRDKIVLIGYSDRTDRNSDIWNTPFQEMPGVVLQGQMISQILSAVLDGRPLIWWWPLWGEMVWIGGWALVGGIAAWRCRPDTRLLVLCGGPAILLATCSLIMVHRTGWVPFVPAAIAYSLTGTTVMILNYRLRHV